MPTNRSEKEAKAVQIWDEKSDLTIQQVAALVGYKSYRSLYLLAGIRRIVNERKAAKAESREEFIASLPRGSKSDRDPYQESLSLECWDENQKEPIDILIDREEVGDFVW
jgi:hypothetical protein